MDIFYNNNQVRSIRLQSYLLVSNSISFLSLKRLYGNNAGTLQSLVKVPAVAGIIPAVSTCQYTPTDRKLSGPASFCQFGRHIFIESPMHRNLFAGSRGINSGN